MLGNSFRRAPRSYSEVLKRDRKFLVLPYSLKSEIEAIYSTIVSTAVVATALYPSNNFTPSSMTQSDLYLYLVAPA